MPIATQMIDFVGGNYRHDSTDLSRQEVINLYPELIDNGSAKAKIVYLKRPGTRELIDLTGVDASGIIRGAWTTQQGRLFVATGSKILEIYYNDMSAGYDSIDCGSIGDGSTSVSMSDNGSQLGIADGSVLRYIDLSLPTPVVSLVPNYYPTNPEYIVNLSGYFIVSNGTQTFHVSAADDVTTWDVLDQYDTSIKAPIINIKVIRGELWTWSKFGFEIFQLTSDPDVPWIPIQGTAANIGCASARSVAVIGDSVFWLGSAAAGNNSVFACIGSYNAVRVSDHAIEQKISRINASDSIGYAIQLNGHMMYVMTVSELDETFIKDVESGLWSKFSTRDPLLNLNHKWEPTFSTFAFDRIILGSNIDNRLLYLDADAYDDWDGRRIVCDRYSPALWNSLELFNVDEFVLDIDTGTTSDLSGIDEDPVVMARFSVDGGNVFGVEQTASFGKTGEYTKRVTFRRPCRRTRELVVHIRISAKCKIAILGARAKVTRLGKW